MPLVTRANVELAKVGIWPAHTEDGSDWTCTRAQIADAVRAAASGRFQSPIIRPGHIDPRHDGEPALGRVSNVRASDDGETLIGDLLIPDWLDAELPAIYPSRSVEADLGVEMQDGERYGMVMTGLALLGVKRPAIEGLAELEAEPLRQEYVAAASIAASMAVAQAAGDKPDGMSVGQTQVQAGFFDAAAHPRGQKGSATGGQFVAGSGDGYKSKGKGSKAGTVKGVQAELIKAGVLGARDGKNGVGADGLFGPKTEAAVKAYQKKLGLPPTGKVTASLMSSLQRGNATKAAKAKTAKTVKKTAPKPSGKKTAKNAPVKPVAKKAVPKAPAKKVAAAHASNEGDRQLSSPWGWEVNGSSASRIGAPLVDIAQLREALGLDSEVDDDAVLAYVGELKTFAEQAEQDPEPDTGTQPVVSHAQDDSQDYTPRPAPVVDNIDAMVAEKVAAALRPMEQALSQVSGELAARKAADVDATKTGVIQAALRSGKITPAARPQWEADYDEAPTVTTRILASLKAGTAMPVAASGYAGTGESVTGDDMALYESWFGKGGASDG